MKSALLGFAIAIGLLLAPVAPLSLGGPDKSPPTCAQVRVYPGVFYSAPTSDAAKVAEGIVLLGIRTHTYSWAVRSTRSALIVGRGFGVAVIRRRPGVQDVLGMIPDLPRGCRDAKGAADLLLKRGRQFLDATPVTK